MFKKILSFLFGKNPPIFNKKGEIQHDFCEQKWTDWKNRFQNNPAYDVKKHSGFSSHS